MVEMVEMVEGCFLPKKKSKKNKISLECREEEFRSEYGENFWRDHRLFSPVSVFACSQNRLLASSPVPKMMGNPHTYHVWAGS